MKSFSTLFQPMLNYCRKFEDVKFNIFEDMTLQRGCIFVGHPKHRDISSHHETSNLHYTSFLKIFVLSMSMNILSVEAAIAIVCSLVCLC